MCFYSVTFGGLVGLTSSLTRHFDRVPQITVAGS